MKAFLVGLQFLTRLPIRMEMPAARDLAMSYLFYPVIGASVGAGGIALRHAAGLVFPEAFSIVLVLAFFVWISGGLHEDALSDVADAMGGGHTRERRLEIMKDPHMGAFGAVAIVLALLAKYSALTSMDQSRVDRALLVAQILGRWSFLPLGYFNREVAPGLGAEMIRHLRGSVLVGATIVAFGGAALLYGLAGFGLASLGSIVVLLASLYFRTRLGGVTGDCFGATFHFVEIVTYAAFLA